MRRFGLLLLAVLGLPLLWALGGAFLEGLATGTVSGPMFTQGRVGFLLGAAAMVALYVWKGRALTVVYVFAHEMTHALAGLLFFARIHRVNVQETGGFVELSKRNLVIALAPYCVPLYLLVAVGMRGLTVWLWPDAVPFVWWSVLFGILTLFHVLYTADALLTVAQPDLCEYGRFFSCWLILAVNLFFASLALTITGQVGAFAQARTLAGLTVRSYVAVVRAVAVPVRALMNRSEEAPARRSPPPRESSARISASLPVGGSL